MRTVIGKWRSRLAFTSVMVLGTLVLGACGTTNSPKPAQHTTINFGSFPGITPVALLQADKTLEREGYTVNWLNFPGSLPTEAQAMASGSLDFAWGNTASAMTIFASAPGVGWLVGDSFTNENAILVREGSGITKISQLTNQKVLTSTTKTAVVMEYDIALAHAGVAASTNTLVLSGNATMGGVMASGAANVALSYTPFSAEMVLSKTATVLATANQILGVKVPGDGIVVRQGFAKAHPQAVVAVLKAVIQADESIISKPTVADTVLAKFAGVPASVIRYSFSSGLIGMNKCLVPDMSNYELLANLEEKDGFAPSGVNLVAFAKTFVNPTFAREAAG